MKRAAARLWIAVSGALLACAGCGFKGPLYLPERNGTVITRPAQATTPAPTAGQASGSSAKSKGNTPSSPPAPPPSSSPPTMPPQNSAPPPPP